MMIVKAGLNTGTNNPHSPYVDLGVELTGLTTPGYTPDTCWVLTRCVGLLTFLLIRTFTNT